MWKAISQNNQSSISDAISYLLCILDLKIPDTLLQSSYIFKKIPTSDYVYIKPNSLSILKNYLEKIYSKSTKNNKNYAILGGNPFLNYSHCNHIITSRNKTPKTTCTSRAETPKILENKKKNEAHDRKGLIKAPKGENILKNSNGRLKRSQSSCKSHKKDTSSLHISGHKNKSPVVGIEVNKTNGNSNKLILYKEDLKKNVYITINL